MIRPTNEQSLKEVIEELISSYKLSEGLNEARLKQLWELTMGKVIASKTMNVMFRDGRLTVKLNSSVLRQELTYRKDEIIRALNEALENDVVKDLKLS